MPDPNLLSLNPVETVGATQTLDSLEDFVPSEWGLPHGAKPAAAVEA